MQFKHYLITACIFMLTFFTVNKNLRASCNWQSKGISFTTFDTCNRIQNLAVVKVNTQQPLTCNRYEWYANGKIIKYQNTSTLYYYVTQNGTYNLCVKLIDTCNKCDTTICVSVTVNCIKSCNWYKKNLSFTVSDSCASNNGFINARVSPVTGCYKYSWRFMGKNTGTTSAGSNTWQVYKNWTYDVCLTLEDTCNNCDTTLCGYAQANCAGLSCDWNPRNLMLSLYDSCFNDKKGTYKVRAEVANPDSCYAYELMLNDHTDSSAYSISGIYNGPWSRDICMKVTNKCTGCDTFVCVLYKPNCGIANCYWDTQSLQITVYDSCLSNDVAVIWASVTNPDSSYSYSLRMPNTIDSGDLYVTGLLYGPYSTDICMSVTNNCTGCDTFVCITYKPKCITLKTQNLQQRSLLPYPNPAKGKLYLKGLSQPASFVLSDLTGRIIMEGNLKDANTPINLLGINRGIYNLNIKNKNYRIVLE